MSADTEKIVADTQQCIVKCVRLNKLDLKADLLESLEMEGEDSRRREDEDLFTRIRVYHIFLACNNKDTVHFYIAQYPVHWTAQSALHFLPPLADLFIPTPTSLLLEAF